MTHDIVASGTGIEEFKLRYGPLCLAWILSRETKLKPYQDKNPWLPYQILWLFMSSNIAT